MVSDINNNQVSVCLVAYNGQNFIKEQIDSILSDLTDDDQLIIVDDCSIDSTNLIIENIRDKRVLHIRNDKNIGLNKNVEKALSFATGEYIFLADQDDIWLKGKVSTMKTQLQFFSLVVSDCFVLKNNKIISYSYFNDIKISTGLINNLIKCKYLGCCMAFNRQLLKCVLPIPSKYVGHDLWIGAICKIAGFRIYMETKQLIIFRRHSSNLSSSFFKSNRPLSVKILHRVFAILLILKRFLVIKSRI